MKRLITILIVEDNPADVELAQEVLVEYLNARVFVASDGVEAIEYLEQHAGSTSNQRPDLMLLDLNLPRKSGLDVLRFVKHDPRTRRIPVLMFTSSTTPRDIDACYDLGANCYIPKPMDLAGFERVARVTEQFWLGLARLPSH